MKKSPRPATLKQPKKVEVKTFIPWMIIVSLAVFGAGLVTGWTLRTEQISQVQYEVARQLDLANKAETAKK